MKTKLTIFLSIPTFFAIILFLNFRTLPLVSAEEFSSEYARSDFASTSEALGGTYEFDPNHATIGFRAKHLGLIDVPGYFRDFTGTINYDAKDVSKSTVEFTAKMTSIDTGVERRDNHLRSKDFFEVETYPEMKFKSTKVEKSGNVWTVSGDLSIKDVTKRISFPIDIAGFLEQPTEVKMGATGQTTINRREFNINWGGNLPNGTAMVADDIKVDLQIEAVKKKKQEAPAEKN